MNLSFIKSISFVILMLLFAACQPKKETPLRIATAANMQFAMAELIKAFEEKTTNDCEAVISSSGKLTAQIKAGAPYDVFVSADLKYPTNLYQNNFATSAPKIYALGKLVLWTNTKNTRPHLDLLSDKAIKHIALANPKTAPYGRAAMEVLKQKKLLKSVESKLVFGESIAQTNQFIYTQTAKLGFTAQSVVLSPKMKGVGEWLALDSNLYTPIEQGIVLLKKTDKAVEAQQFYDFLFSEKGKQILTTFGYGINQN